MFAKCYDILMADVDYGLLYQFYEAHKPKKQSTVIDAGCGSGHFLLELVSRNEDAMGIDKDEAMLSIALDKLKSRGLYTPLFVHDLKDPLSIKADVITSFFDVVNYFKGVKGLFRNLYHGLNDGGVLLFDCYKEEVLDSYHGYTEEGMDPIEYKWSIQTDKNKLIHHVNFDGHIEKIIQYVHPIKRMKLTLENIGFHVTVEEGVDARKWYVIAKKDS